MPVLFTNALKYTLTRLTEKISNGNGKPNLGDNDHNEQHVILSTINDLQHIGQAGYVRGLFDGIGWYWRVSKKTRLH